MSNHFLSITYGAVNCRFGTDNKPSLGIRWFIVTFTIINLLTRGGFAAAEDFVDSGMEDSQLYVDFVLKRLFNLKAVGVEPIVVFDGRRNNLKVLHMSYNA